MKIRLLYILFIVLAIVSCQNIDEHKTVICIPVYGQSLALGVEAQRVTDFDSLANYANGRIVTENMDHHYGYFDISPFKQFTKKILHYQKNSNELTAYSMAEVIADNTGKDTLICIFPCGKDGTVIAELGKGSKPYNKFIHDIETAYQSAHKRGWDFLMPALCWMQGETDVTSYPGTNYRELLLQFVKDINHDVKTITGQQKDVEIICYQSNPVTRAKDFSPLAYNCPEASVPQTQLELVRDHPAFHASGPTYPYNIVNDVIHIDGISQKKHGILAALAALDILKQQKHKRGLLPLGAHCHSKEIIIDFDIPCPPLILDTIQVTNPGHYGFSVITPDNRDITQDVILKGNQIHISCLESSKGCRVRYAINGDKMKSGRLFGPRGNLRDSQGDSIKITIQNETYPIHNWCYQFDMPIESDNDEIE